MATRIENPASQGHGVIGEQLVIDSFAPNFVPLDPTAKWDIPANTPKAAHVPADYLALPVSIKGLKAGCKSICLGDAARQRSITEDFLLLLWEYAQVGNDKQITRFRAYMIPAQEWAKMFGLVSPEIIKKCAEAASGPQRASARRSRARNFKKKISKLLATSSVALNQKIPTLGASRIQCSVRIEAIEPFLVYANEDAEPKLFGATPVNIIKDSLPRRFKTSTPTD